MEGLGPLGSRGDAVRDLFSRFVYASCPVSTLPRKTCVSMSVS